MKIPANTPRTHLADEIAHFAGFHWSDQAIAERLNVAVGMVHEYRRRDRVRAAAELEQNAGTGAAP